LIERWIAIAVAKKTGDYSVLSHADICVVALTYELDLHEKEEAEQNKVCCLAGPMGVAETHQDSSEVDHTVKNVEEITEHLSTTKLEGDGDDEISASPLDTEQDQANEDQLPEPGDLPERRSPTPLLYEDPSDDDDGEGDWITPTNVSLHKSQALQLIPSKGGAEGRVVTGCMTTDFAMQNVLLHMGLSLVGVDGKKIDRVKTWVLRCHACFK
jgi:RNA-binding protein NOB1